MGDGTTSVIILAGEMLAVTEPFLQQNVHPITLFSAYFRALETINRAAESVSKTIDVLNEEVVREIVNSCVGTKFASMWSSLIVDLAVQAVRKCYREVAGKPDVDTKRYARIEKIPGGSLEECVVLDGVMFNKDLTHPKMRRLIDHPRVILLDCPLDTRKVKAKLTWK